MRRALWMLALCAACASDDSQTGGFEGVSHVDVHDLPAAPPQKLDLLIVIDDTTAMAPYQSQLATLPAQVADAFVSTSRAIQDLHIAVVTSDGTLRVAPSIGGSYMTVYPEYDLSRITNFTGTFVDALGRLTSVGAVRSGSSQPLTAIRNVLETNPGGFVRESAALGIVIVTANDDASPDAPAEYAQFAKTLKADPANVMVTGITVAASPRLDEFFTSFPNRQRVVSIADTDYAPALTMFAQFIRSLLYLTCWDPPDSDPLTPGWQFDCTFTAFIRGQQRLLQPCRFDGDEFCWRWKDNSGGNGAGCDGPGVEPDTPPWYRDAFRPALRIECVVR